MFSYSLYKQECFHIICINRNDTCIDALTLKILQKETKLRIEGGEGEGRILGEEGEGRILGEERILGEGVIKVGKEEGGGKESILVKLNSRLKSLGKKSTTFKVLFLLQNACCKVLHNNTCVFKKLNHVQF